MTWCQQAITWTNAGFPSVRYVEIASVSSAQTTILYNEFENNIRKITATSPRSIYLCIMAYGIKGFFEIEK